MRRTLRRRLAVLAAVSLTLPSARAWAEPSSEINSPNVEKGETELAAVYGRLDGGPANGADRLRLELEHGFSNRFQLGVRADFDRTPGFGRDMDSVGIEGIYHLGQVGGIDVGVYGEYEFVRHDADAIETKVLFERRAGKFDAKLNLIAEKELEHGEPLEFEYAASADYEAIGELRLGVAAFGELGTSKDFLPRADHYLGPVLKTEIEGMGPELEIEAGYLFALGKAKDDSDGQFRLVLEMEF